MDVVVFGANGPTGRLTVERALSAGHAVRAVTRHPDDFPIVAGDVEVVGGDVFDPEAVDRAVAGADAVISTLGVPFGRGPISVYSVGIDHILGSMDRHGVRRVVAVTSSSMEPPPDQEGGIFFRRVLQPFVTGWLGRTLYDDMRRMEARLSSCDLAWTIVRPSGLFHAGAVTSYRVGDGHLPGRFTAREDLADLLVRELEGRDHIGCAVAITTVEGQPSMAQMFWREGIRKRP